MNAATRKSDDMRRAMEASRPNPDPRIVWLIDYAINSITPRLRDKEYAPWLAWAAVWLSGCHSPGQCVKIANECFRLAKEDGPAWHTLGQLAWGAKEACYRTPTSGWLVIRYIADAMVAFGIAYPSESFPVLAEQTDPASLLENPDV